MACEKWERRRMPRKRRETRGYLVGLLRIIFPASYLFFFLMLKLHITWSNFRKVARIFDIFITTALKLNCTVENQINYLRHPDRQCRILWSHWHPLKLGAATPSALRFFHFSDESHTVFRSVILYWKCPAFLSFYKPFHSPENTRIFSKVWF